jgi:alkylation response protein AidB-like acyl-CoA dehydrogenase
MKFTLTEEHAMIQEMARDFAQADIAPSSIKRDKNEEFPTEIIKKMADLGLMGMMVDPKYDGAGMDTVSYCLAMMEVSKVDASVGVIMSVTNSLVTFGITAQLVGIAFSWEVGKGFTFAMNTLNGGRYGIASQAVGIAQASLEAAINYAKTRKTFGTEIANHQAIQFKIADMATRTEAAKLLTLQAATLKDEGKPYIKEASMAKLFASETAVKNALEAIQIHGGYGYVREYKVERYLRDAKITEIYEGTNEIQRIIIGRQLLRD